MKFSSYLDPKMIFTDMDVTGIKEAIAHMIEKMAEHSPTVAARQEELTYSALKRENEISTCVGNGIAVPHGRLENFNDLFVSLAVLKKPVGMEVGLTGKKDAVDVVFLVLCDVLKNKNILKIMSAISKLALQHKDVLERIRREQDPKVIHKLIHDAGIEVGRRIVAEDVLSPDVIPAGPDDTLEKIVKRLILERLSGLPVVDADGTFLGEITEKELIEFGMPDYLSYIGNLNFLTVGEPFEEYMRQEKTATIRSLYRKAENVVAVDKKTPILEICSIIVKKGVTRFYVVEKKKYCGVIRRSDILKKVLHI